MWPSIFRKETTKMKNKINKFQQGRKNIVVHPSTSFAPAGLGCSARDPAINRWAIFGCPYGTKTRRNIRTALRLRVPILDQFQLQKHLRTQKLSAFGFGF